MEDHKRQFSLEVAFLESKASRDKLPMYEAGGGSSSKLSKNGPVTQ